MTAPISPEPASASADIDATLFTGERSRRAFRFALGGILAVVLLAVVLRPLVLPGQPERVYSLLAFIPVIALALWLAFRDRVVPALRTLAYGSWLVATLAAGLNGGVFGASVFAYPLLIVASGWALGLRTAVTLGILTVWAELGLVVADRYGLLPGTPPPALWAWAIHLFVAAVSVGFVAYAVGGYRQRLAAIAALEKTLGGQQRRIEERERQISEQYGVYQALVDAQSDAGVGLFIIENGRLTYVNAAATRIFGYSVAEMLALPSFLAAVHPDDQGRVSRNHQRRLRGEQFENRYDIGVVTKSGNRKEV